MRLFVRKRAYEVGGEIDPAGEARPERSIGIDPDYAPHLSPAEANSLRPRSRQGLRFQRLADPKHETPDLVPTSE